MQKMTVKLNNSMNTSLFGSEFREHEIVYGENIRKSKRTAISLYLNICKPLNSRNFSQIQTQTGQYSMHTLCGKFV